MRRNTQNLTAEYSNRSGSFQTQLEKYFPTSMDEEDVEDGIPRCIIIPDNLFDLSRNLVVANISAYIALIVPYNLAFSLSDDNSWFLSLLLFVDMLITLNTAYYDNGALIVNRKDIALHYMKFWFWLDLLASLPLDLLIRYTLTPNSQPSASIPKFLWSLRLFRLVKLARFPRCLRSFDEYISSQHVSFTLALSKPFAIALIAAHWAACAIIYIGLNSRYAEQWYLSCIQINESSEFEVYISALYWMITTAVAMGYGDFYPKNIDERGILMVYMVFSSALYSYALADIVDIVTRLQFNKCKHRENVQAINNYLKHKKLPMELRIRVKRYIDFEWELASERKFGEDKLMLFLSQPLKYEIYLLTRGPVLSTCTAFNEFEKQKIQLSNLLDYRMYSVEDVVFDEGEASDEIYFINNGQAQIYHRPSESIFKILGKGSYFGEIAFFSKSPRTASVKCVDFMECYSLSRAKVDNCFKKIPEAKAKLNLLTIKSKESCSILGTNCYTCKKEGHVAINCKLMNFNLDRESLAQKWVRSRQRKEKLVNLHWDNPGYVRKHHYANLKKHYTARNVKSKKKSLDSTMWSMSETDIEERKNLKVTKEETIERLSAIISESEFEDFECPTPYMDENKHRNARRSVILEGLTKNSPCPSMNSDWESSDYSDYG
eukprot:CAMPEP_0204899146 /NCGR_PEP_ID=MMETSP1397-20131031/1683_1 /ASSEMBLY_ACC=CAM_ASM_000891 /TAXON_ID=49980 /ORGANISM="Climacostomum Climacostomum virens, Strain Stock W-24" /LENGTH=660 /DNA_ID=CAMNT_0052067063 /DNA_START=2801 /DNA_END=4783 /DNA_ORIENTATION=+